MKHLPTLSGNTDIAASTKKISLSLTFLLTIILLCGVSAGAQTSGGSPAKTAKTSPYKMEATVLDSVGQPAEYVTWRVFSEADSVKPVTGGIVPASGKISAPLDSAGKYFLHIVSLETAPEKLAFEVSDSHKTANLNKITLRPGAKDLQEVVVTATKPLVVKEIDRIGYDVKADEEAKTSNLSDILRKVPMVSVEDNGTIRVNGGTNFKIYKNGRQNNSFSKNSKDIFKSIPASSIKKIEVITDPGAREDAEGSTMILNIVTDHEMQMSGVTGTAGISLSTENLVPLPYTYFTTQLGKFMLSANGSYWRQNRKSSKWNNVTDGVFKETGVKDHSKQESESESDGGYGSLEMSWEPDTLNLITAEASFWGWNTDADINGYNRRTRADNELIYEYRSKSYYPYYKNHRLDGTFNYQRSTSLKGETFTLSYLISYGKSKNSSRTEYYDAINMPVLYTGQESRTNQTDNEQTVQFDWARPLGKYIKFDTGLKYIYRNNTALNNLLYDGMPSMNTDDKFTQRTDVGALYTDWRVKKDKWSARAGIRYEYSRLGAKFHSEKRQDYHSNFNDWVPNVTVGYDINDATTMKVTYNRRIRRPGVYYLDPTVKETPTTIMRGNPDLESAYQNTLNYNFSMFKAKFNIDFSLQYSFNNDGFLNVQTILPSNVLSYTYENAEKSRNVSADLYVRYQITPKTSVMLNGSYGWSRVEDPTRNLHLSRPNYNFYANVSQKLPYKFSLRAYGYVYSGWSELYNYSKLGFRAFRYGISLSRNWLKEDRLTTQAQINNPFGPYHPEYRGYSANSSYVTEQRSWSEASACRVSLSISYRFGNLQASVKKTSRSIVNDDTDGKNKGQGGGGGGK